MINRYLVHKDFFTFCAFALIGCMVLISCDKEKEFTPAMPEAKLINSITFDVSNTLPIAIGMDSTLVYTVGPETADDLALKWTSSDETVATVKQDGTITGVAEGTAIISATPPIGFGATASVTVSVVPEIIKATSLKIINPKEGKDIYETDKIDLGTEILPVDHTYDYLTWLSSDQSIATVSNSGLVTCLKSGDVTFTASTHDHSNVVGTYKLTIKKYIPVEDVTIKPYTEPICISLNPIRLDVIYTPDNATLGSVDWSSDNENVATAELGVVTPKGFGSAVITATCQATGKSSSTVITVESGWWIWDARNNFSTWKTPSSGAKTEFKDGKLVVTLNVGTKRRADLKYPVDTTNPLNLHLGNYPVLAMRCTIPKGGNNTFDAVSLDGISVGAPKCNDGITLDDGTRLIYYNIASYNKYSTTEVVGFNTFQIKVADIPTANTTSGTYDVYWIRTFKSISEMEAFAKAEVAAGE